MLERISEWFKQLPKCSRINSGEVGTNLSEICSVIPLNRNNCFLPNQCKKLGKERTELYLTWYAKDSFFECYHKRGSALLNKPWKSVVMSPHESNNILYLIFVDMCTLQHKVFNLSDKKSWRSTCHIMFEEEHRPSKLFMRYRYPFNTRAFELYAQSCGYAMCGWNSHKFLQKQIQYFKETYEIVSKVKYILSNSSTVEYDLTLLQNFVRRNLPEEEESCASDQDESEGVYSEEKLITDTEEEVDNLSSKEDKSETPSFGNTKTDGTTRNKKIDKSYSSKDVSSSVNKTRSKLKHNLPEIDVNSKTDSIESHSTDHDKRLLPLSSSLIASMTHFFIENKRLKNAILKSNVKNKLRENKLRAPRKGECFLLDITIKEDMYYFIFIDADSCYPQVVESECCDETSCIDSCTRFLERHPGTKEFHVPLGKPFDSEEFKNYLEIQGIECYLDSPLLQYLKQPKAAFSVIRRIISRNYSNEKMSKVLSEFVKKKIIIRNIIGRRNVPKGVVHWKGKRVLAVEMTNEEGDYLLLIDLEKALVEAYPKKPNGRFIFPQEMIVIFVQAFNELGIPKELHTIGSNHLDSQEFNRLIQYCHIKHCANCWHADEGTPHFETLEQMKSCFERTANIESGFQLWQSLKKRLKVDKRTEPKRTRKISSIQRQNFPKERGKNIYKYSKNFSDSHLLNYVVGQALWKMNHKKRKEEKRHDVLKKRMGNKNHSRDFPKRRKSKKLRLSVKREKHSGQMEGAKYHKMLNKLLKRREIRNDGFEKPRNVSLRQRKPRSNEKLKKNQYKRISKYKENSNSKLFGYGFI